MTDDQKQRRRESRRAWKKANPDKVRAEKKAYRIAHPEMVLKKRQQRQARKTASRVRGPGRPAGRNLAMRAARQQRSRFAKYGITPVEFLEMWRAQGGLCALCKQPLQEVVDKRDARHTDHDHVTGKVRGILHRDCNLLIGIARDSAALLLLAAEYLTEHGAVEKPRKETAPEGDLRQPDLFALH